MKAPQGSRSGGDASDVVRILFACIGNSVRSQIAEGFARRYAVLGRVDVRSGGTSPSGYVHPAAIRLMKEVGIDISTHRSKRIDLDFALHAHAFVTLCGPLDGACPHPIAERAIDWSCPDPTALSPAQQREIRDEIGTRVRGLLDRHGVLEDVLR